jgi:hypothetical protein
MKFERSRKRCGIKNSNCKSWILIFSKADIKTKIGLQRKEYEGTIKRHLGFIDKLLAEKDQLALKCESLSLDVKKMEKGFKEKVSISVEFIFKCRNMEEHNLKDVKQQRELWQATEKVKRDKWITDKTRVIKDQTVKGLEPEIQRMLAVSDECLILSNINSH